MSDYDDEQFLYVPHEVRMEYERLKNNWLNQILDQMALAPGKHSAAERDSPKGEK